MAFLGFSRDRSTVCVDLVRYALNGLASVYTGSDAILKAKRNRIALTCDIIASADHGEGFSVTPLSTQLGDLDDAEAPAWDDDIDSTLHEHRAEKHRTRMEEHDRRMREKRGQRATTGYL
ncbi:hypothetical protein Y032_0209g2090 [Ancylostoma ceylanicum]|uniref:Uncharacterized protein n=1 Tax=Ancylostoma ceylanicum TaxID=53326 RepID=A0A016SKM0_9BILA|nr:hypothetical protein Y032_0209g2090 [Ancylostoma ceylanicum]